MKNTKVKAQQGITLIALIITIIVLIILAGITLQAVIGENSILTKGTEAKQKQNIAEYLEVAELVRGNINIEKYTSDTPIEYLARFQEDLKEESKYEGASYVLTEEDLKVTTKEGYILTITENDLQYEVGDSSGEGGEEPENPEEPGEEDPITITEQDIQFSGQPDTWTNQDITLTIQTNVQEGTLEYSEDGTSWYPYEEPLTIDENKMIYTRIKVSDTNISNIIVHEIKWIDQEVPTGEIVLTDRTENSITVQVNATDTLSGVKEYHYYYKTSSDASYTDAGVSKENTFNLPNMTIGNTYQLQVVITDNAGNEATINYEILFEDAVAKVDNEYFKSVQLAVDSVEGTEQKTVEVLKSVTEQVTIPQNKNIILDGGGFTYTGKVTNHGTLEVQNGTFNNTDVVINNDGGNLQIKADNVTMTGSALNCPTILNNNQGTAVVTAGTYFSETDHVAENINSTMELGGTVKMNGSDVIEQATQKAYPVVSNISGGNLKITGGEYKGVGNSVWNRENAGTLEITGGTFINESDTNCNINLDSTAKLTISGGSFTSKRRRNWK